jgi:hypothetical protein
MPLFLIYLFLSYSMKTWADVYIVLHCLACWRGLDASWSRIEVSLLVVCWDFYFGSLRSKSVEKLPNFPPVGLEPMPLVTVALTAQYLNVRQRKLGTIIIHSLSYSIKVRSQIHCLRRNLCMGIPTTFKWPSPAVVPLYLCTNRGGALYQ